MSNLAAGATTMPDLTGELYTDVLERMHKLLRPKTYLEIGTRHGDSLRYADCPSIAIDPQFLLRQNTLNSKSSCFYFQMTSDTFFKLHSPTKLLGQELDLAFLDGLHLFDFLLRDFENVEKHCSPNSVIMMHDCIPVDVFIAGREETDAAYLARGQHPGWWTGDVWKVLPILQEVRPKLKIHSFDASPTGLVMITNLDPTSTAISDNYFDILHKWRGVDLEKFGIEKLFSSINVRSTQELKNFEGVSEYFWL